MEGKIKGLIRERGYGFIIALVLLLLASVFFFVGFQVKAEYFQPEPEKVFIEVVIKTPPPEPEVIVEERKVVVERVVKVNRELKDFATYVEFKEVMQKYHRGILLMGGTCVEQSRLIVEVGREDGYYLDTEMVRNDRHMVVKGFLLDAGNGKSGIGLFDQETGLTWLKYQTVTE